MFAFYEGAICYVEDSTNQYYILLEPKDDYISFARHIVKAEEIQFITLPYDFDDDLLEIMIKTPFTNNRYIKQHLEHTLQTLVWRFTYHSQKRNVYRIVKFFPDGFLADVGDDERRHFKCHKIEEDEGLVPRSCFLR